MADERITSQPDAVNSQARDGGAVNLSTKPPAQANQVPKGAVSLAAWVLFGIAIPFLLAAGLELATGLYGALIVQPDIEQALRNGGVNQPPSAHPQLRIEKTFRESGPVAKASADDLNRLLEATARTPPE